jgi:hypothetical protein
MRVENANGVPMARVVDVVSQLPGVAAAAASTSVPYAASGPQQRVSADAAGSNPIKAEQALVSPEFFATLDVPIRAGRSFTYQDVVASRVSMVNEALARRLFAGADPLGRRVWVGETSYEIVGVVADYVNEPFQGQDWRPKLYLPLTGTRATPTRMQFLIRASGDPAAVARTLRKDVQSALPGNAVTNAIAIDRIIEIGGQEMLVGTAPLAPLVATGMLLTAAGIYGVLAFAITRRSSCGASGDWRERPRSGVARQRSSLRLVTIGTECGIGVTYTLTTIMRAAGGGSALDPHWAAFVVPVVVVAVIATLATWIPSRRAMDINPAATIENDVR